MVTAADIHSEPLDLSHLHPAAQRIALLPDAERQRYVRADRWIGYTRATAALERLETLFAWPAKQRMPNLLLIGPTNNGKSMIIEKFHRSHPPVSHADAEKIPVLVVQMPSEPSVARFYILESGTADRVPTSGSRDLGRSTHQPFQKSFHKTCSGSRVRR